MGIVVVESFDAVTSPTFPSGWVAGSGLETESAHFASAPNGLGNTVSGALCVAYFDTADPNGGDVAVSATVLPNIAGIGGSNVRDVWLFARMTVATTSPVSGHMTSYWAYFDTIGATLLIGKNVSGALTTLASFASATLAGLAAVVRFQIIALGDALSIQVQRLSDGQWLNGSDAWQAAPVDALAVSDPGGISGVGRAGLAMQRSSSGNLVYLDNFVFQTAPVPARRRRADLTYV